MADAITDRITYDSYKIDIDESIDSNKDLSMREVYEDILNSFTPSVRR